MTEADRIFNLIEDIKANKPVAYQTQADQDCLWKVSFKGEPSFRHINRIVMFRDYLAAMLPGTLETVGGERGSVVVLFAASGEASEAFKSASKTLADQLGDFAGIAEFLGISSLEFDGHRKSF